MDGGVKAAGYHIITALGVWNRARPCGEPRDGKNYLIDKPAELWLFHGMNNGTVRPRVKGKAVGESAPILYTEDETGPWTAANLTAFCVVNLIPHYFTFPPFPEERGYANEVQRARIGAATQLQGGPSHLSTTH